MVIDQHLLPRADELHSPGSGGVEWVSALSACDGWVDGGCEAGGSWWVEGIGDGATAMSDSGIGAGLGADGDCSCK